MYIYKYIYIVFYLDVEEVQSEKYQYQELRRPRRATRPHGGEVAKCPRWKGGDVPPLSLAASRELVKLRSSYIPPPRENSFVSRHDQRVRVTSRHEEAQHRDVAFKEGVSLQARGQHQPYVRSRPRKA